MSNPALSQGCGVNGPHPVTSYPHLQALVCNAGLDEALCERLLGGDRPQVIAAFKLSRAEREVILAIEADTLQAFAQALHQWMTRQR